MCLERDVLSSQSSCNMVEIGYADAETGEADRGRTRLDGELAAVAERVVSSVRGRQRAGECAEEAGMVFRAFRIQGYRRGQGRAVRVALEQRIPECFRMVLLAYEEGRAGKQPLEVRSSTAVDDAALQDGWSARRRHAEHHAVDIVFGYSNISEGN